jgi:hypothetical protein
MQPSLPAHPAALPAHPADAEGRYQLYLRRGNIQAGLPELRGVGVAQDIPDGTGTSRSDQLAGRLGIPPISHGQMSPNRA